MDTQTAAFWQLIATIAGVVVVLWYSLETRWLRHETKNLLNEAKIQNETALRPIIDFCFDTVGTGVYGKQFLKVRNVGRGPAFNLWAKPFTAGNMSIGMSLPQSLPAERDQSCCFELYSHIGPHTASSPQDIFGKIEEIAELPITLKITYTNASGQRYYTTLIVKAGSDVHADIMFGGSGRIDDSD